MTTSCRKYVHVSLLTTVSPENGAPCLQVERRNFKTLCRGRKKGSSSSEKKKTCKTILGSEYSMGCKMWGHTCSSTEKFQWLTNMTLLLWAPGPTNGEMTGGYEQRQGRAHWRERRKFKYKIYGVNNGSERRVRDDWWLYILIAICCIQLAPKGIKCTWSIRFFSPRLRMLC